MADGKPPDETEQVECKVCRKEIPRSEATSDEATDYVTYFCGLDCYEKWKKQFNDAKQEGPGGSDRKS
ncbi:MAG: DUF3330 domain-containing protein [Thiogranum sp.]|nr:DUF3330 domain-containing protein [Thiogranum sp.]